MIERLAANTITPDAQPVSGTARTRIERQTPFGAVMVDELATTNVFALVTAPSAAAPTAPASPAYPEAPTAESLFGEHPWMETATGSGPLGQYGHNPIYFATRPTAEKVAAMVGGKVVERNFLTPYGPFQQQTPNLMIELPNGKLIVAGLVANFFAHGYSQQFVDRLLKNEIEGA